MKKFKCNCKCSFDPKELLFFNQLIMPQILTFIFWIVCVIVIVSSFFSMFFSFWWGLISLVIGLISTRISFEMICVVFSINKNLEKLVQLQSPAEPEVVVEPVATVAEVAEVIVETVDADADADIAKDDKTTE